MCKSQVPANETDLEAISEMTPIHVISDILLIEHFSRVCCVKVKSRIFVGEKHTTKTRIQIEQIEEKTDSADKGSLTQLTTKTEKRLYKD